MIDVSATASKAGLNIPVAVTASIWENYIKWTEIDSEQQVYQNMDLRLWDILLFLHTAITKKHDTDLVFYKISIVPRDGKAKNPTLVNLKAVFGVGDNDERVITIMLSDED